MDKSHLEHSLNSDSSIDMVSVNNTSNETHHKASSTDMSVISAIKDKSSQLRPLTIGIVAGEASGDSLGADFMHQINALRDDIVWIGVGGAKMQQQGLQSLFDMSRLSVMGLVEVVSHLPDLLKARRQLIKAFTKAKIDWFVGIDAPDFNLRVAKKLKPKGVFCVQYVSPSVWAWRESRITSIMQATHLVLCLFPFELDVYQKYNHPAICVGHPLLYTIDASLLTKPRVDLLWGLVWSNPELKQFFNELHRDLSQLVCLMPGSRRSEINAILPLMLDAIQKLLLVDNNLCFIIPTIDKNHQYIVQDLIDHRNKQIQEAVVVVFDDNKNHTHFSQYVMAASDIVILASGTATLEAMLLRRPMVVVYQLNKLTYRFAKRLLKVPYVSLPNILANERIVPELIQDEATGESICRTATQLLQTRAFEEQQDKLDVISAALREQSNQSAAHAVISVWMDTDL